MKNRLFSLILILLASMLSTSISAQTNVGVNYNQVANEIGWGLTADTEFNLTESLKSELSLNGQNTGSLYQGKLVAEVGLPVGAFEVAVASETKLIGTQLNALGRDTSIGLKGTANIGQVGVTFGVFGANAGEFGPRNAQDILVDDNGFDFRQLEGLGLDTLTAPSNHLSIKDGNRINLRIGLETKLFDDRFEVALSLRPELGADENPVHQAVGTVRTGFGIGDKLKVIWQGEFGIQTWEDSFEKQWAGGFTLSYSTL